MTNIDTKNSLIFDYEAVCKRLFDDKNIVNEVVKVFLQDMPQQLKEINALVSKGDVEQVAIQAHKIKGSSANMGGMVLSELAKTIEFAGKESDSETINQQLPKLQQSFDLLKDEMEKVLF